MDPINKCVTGDLGNNLEHQMALQTGLLSPPHTYVPWITFDGVGFRDYTQITRYMNIDELVCLVKDLMNINFV